MSSKSLKYYHEKVKNDPIKMEKRRIYYREYYKKNKKPSTKKNKSKGGITIQRGNFLLIFD